MKKYSTAVKLTGVAIFVLLFSGVVLLGAELYMRYTGKYPRSHFRYDENLIWRLRSNYNGMKTWGKDHFPLQFNNKGFRGPDLYKEKKEGVRRLMVIGDSYTASMDVRYEDLYTTLLQNKLGEKYEVLNTSCPAWGTDQEYIFWITEGVEYQPDYMLLMVSPNDLREMYMKNLCELNAEGEVVVNPAKYPAKARRGWAWSNRSALFQYFQKEVWDTHYGHFWDIFEHYPVNFGREDSTNWDLPIFLKDPFPEVAESRVLFKRLIEEMKEKADAIGCKMMLSVIPTKMEFDGTLDDDKYEPGKVAQLLEEVANEQNIPYLNLYKELSQAEDPMELFISWEFHFNEEGNRYLAEKLYPFLADHLK